MLFDSVGSLLLPNYITGSLYVEGRIVPISTTNCNLFTEKLFRSRFAPSRMEQVG
ncbi:predicted protein [Sclerotinia sclerotiorum 1980 UF-70]|uniref:Uncharacterized protein n=1 Tax=Sclerotinia sclerotiorum (strain ATCC 18683 / 1980 / Ss-1) TaxID=665079 RepID=A7F473_SCLS1|nr:predicted protein [Sclerotinia sclerotiorum 1980 UF-70]EDN97544.1 predicted protein [Sclerotinia sclerotiorum 1980 UF-70]